jgi:hypothetical protein
MIQLLFLLCALTILTGGDRLAAASRHRVLLIDFAAPDLDIIILKTAVLSHLDEQPVSVSLLDGRTHHATETSRAAFARSSATENDTAVWFDPDGTAIYLLTPRISDDIKRQPLDDSLETWVVKCELSAAVVTHEVTAILSVSGTENSAAGEKTLESTRRDRQRHPPSTPTRADAVFEAALGIGYSPIVLSFQGLVLHAMNVGLVGAFGRRLGVDVGGCFLGRTAITAGEDTGTYIFTTMRLSVWARQPVGPLELSVRGGGQVSFWRIRGLASPNDAEVASLQTAPALLLLGGVMYRILSRAALFLDIGAAFYFSNDRFEVAGKSVLRRDAVQLRAAVGIAIWIARVMR